MLEVVKWCSLCNSQKADGTLVIEDSLKERYPVPACQQCVDKLEDWVEDGQGKQQ